MLRPSHQMTQIRILALIISLTITLSNNYAFAAQNNFFDTLDPRSKSIEKTLRELDQEYERVTGLWAHPEAFDPLVAFRPNCYRNSCKLWAHISIDTQRLDVYIDGVLTYTWKTSTGRFGYETPFMDTHPDGRMYEIHTSPKYPEGDYNGLGNMPFAVFIDGGYAIHGTTRGSFGKLGSTASHGCIRLHPDNAEMFYVLVRRSGIRKVWVTID